MRPCVMITESLSTVRVYTLYGLVAAPAGVSCSSSYEVGLVSLNGCVVVGDERDLVVLVFFVSATTSTSSSVG